MQQSCDMKPTESPDDLGRPMAQRTVFGQPVCFSLQHYACDLSRIRSGEHRWHYGRKNYSHHTSHTFQYKWGAKVLFTYATSHPQFSWICLKLGGSVPIGILAVA